MTRTATPAQSSTRAAGGGETSASRHRPEERLAGYRVVRRAADRHGGRVRTGRRDDGDAPPGEMRSPVSLVTFDPTTAGEQAMRLIERLDLLAGPAVPRIVDVADDPSDGPVVVLEFCGETVASTLAAGTGLAAGEVVTLVAPILAAVQSLHDRGFSHGGLSVASISIGVGGTPLLLGVERAVELGDDRHERERAARDDLLGIADVLVDLAAAVRDPSHRRRIGDAAAAIRSAAGSPFSSASRAIAEVRLFEIAEPCPIVFTAPGGDPTEGERRPLPPVRDARRRRPREPRPAARAVLVDIALRLVALTRRLVPLRSLRRARTTAARRRRGPLVLGAAIVVATVLAVILVPRGSGGGADGVPEPAPTNATPVAAGTTDGAGETPDGDGDGDGGGDGDGDGGAGDDPVESESSSTSTDVVVGTRAVLDGAAGCAVSRADGCWDELIEPGTALAEELAGTDDPLSALPAALALPVDAVELRPRDDYGDARVVLVVPSDGTRPASVLMIRTEAGWRLREAFDA